MTPLRALPALLLGALLAGCSSEPLPAPEGWERGPARILRTLRAEGPLLAGAARVSLDPPYAVPMGGYFGGSEFLLREQRDPLAVRALVLEAGGLRLALVGLDLVLLPPELRPAIEARREFQDAGVAAWTIFASHAHTCMGAFAPAWAAQRFGIGSYDPLILRYIAERSAEAVALAAKRLEPVVAGSAEATLPASEPPVCYNRKVLGKPVDSTLRTLAFRPVVPRPETGNAPLAELVNFAAHPTLIPAHLRRASADYPGILCRDLEREGSIAIFVQGASANLAGGIHHLESRKWWERRLEWIGGRLASLAHRALDQAQPAPEPDTVLVYSEGEILLPPRRPWKVPFIGSSIARNYPERVKARCIRIGDRALIFSPGELGDDLGAALRTGLLAGAGTTGPSPAGGPPPARPREVWIGTLADDYLGYAFSREEYLAGGMSQHLTVYGPDLGPLLIARLADVARACFP